MEVGVGEAVKVQVFPGQPQGVEVEVAVKVLVVVSVGVKVGVEVGVEDGLTLGVRVLVGGASK